MTLPEFWRIQLHNEVNGTSLDAEWQASPPVLRERERERLRAADYRRPGTGTAGVLGRGIGAGSSARGSTVGTPYGWKLGTG